MHRNFRVNNNKTDTIINYSFNFFQKARKRNAELTNNCKLLEEERQLINERLGNTQFEMVTQKNHLNSLLEQLKAQRKINMAQDQRLQICNEQLESLQTEIDKAVCFRNLFLKIRLYLLHDCRLCHCHYWTCKFIGINHRT